MFSINKPTDRTRTTENGTQKSAHTHTLSHMHSRHTQRWSERETSGQTASERWSRIRSFFFLHVRTHTYAMQQREKWEKNATSSTAVCILHNVNTEGERTDRHPMPIRSRTQWERSEGRQKQKKNEIKNNKQQIIVSGLFSVYCSGSLISFSISSKCDFFSLRTDTHTHTRSSGARQLTNCTTTTKQ